MIVGRPKFQPSQRVWISLEDYANEGIPLTAPVFVDGVYWHSEHKQWVYSLVTVYDPALGEWLTWEKVCENLDPMERNEIDDFTEDRIFTIEEWAEYELNQIRLKTSTVESMVAAAAKEGESANE